MCYSGVDKEELNVIASTKNENLYISSFSAQDLADAVTNTARLICENSPAPNVPGPTPTPTPTPTPAPPPPPVGLYIIIPQRYQQFHKDRVRLRLAY